MQAVPTAGVDSEISRVIFKNMLVGQAVSQSPAVGAMIVSLILIFVV